MLINTNLHRIICLFNVELFSWKTTSHKDHLEVCLSNSRLLSGLIRIWSSMKIALLFLQNLSMSVSVLTLTAMAYDRYKGKYVDDYILGSLDLNYVKP